MELSPCSGNAVVKLGFVVVVECELATKVLCGVVLCEYVYVGTVDGGARLCVAVSFRTCEDLCFVWVEL